MNGNVPTSKVTAATAGAALGTVLTFIISVTAGIDIPIGVEGALATLGAFLLGWLVPERRGV